MPPRFSSRGNAAITAKQFTMRRRKHIINDVVNNVRFVFWATKFCNVGLHDAWQCRDERIYIFKSKLINVIIIDKSRSATKYDAITQSSERAC